MRITVGHTPDADDAFMFYGMLEGRIPSRGFAVEHEVADIEELNRRAVAGGAPDVTAASVHACSRMEGYTILRSGGSFGLGYGPILTAARPMGLDEAVRGPVAVPGELTSAFLLLRLMAGQFEHVEMRFSDIPAAVREGRAAAGLVIHESQLSYGEEGNSKVADVGRWWDEATGGLPVPLGVNAMRSSLGADAVREFDAHLRDSIRYGLDHREDAVEYAMRYARGKARPLIDRFVGMYVNEATVDMGERGERAIRTLFSMASERGLIGRFEPEIAPP